MEIEDRVDIEESRQSDVSTEEYFARAAARRQLTPEQLRAQLRVLADESHAYSKHLSFEQLRDSDSTSFSDEDMAHLDQCKYCSRFMQTVQPSRQETARFVDKALKVFKPAQAAASAQVRAWIDDSPRVEASIPLPRQMSHSRGWSVPASVAAGLVLGILGTSTFLMLRDASTKVAAHPATPSPHLATVAKEECTQASGQSQSCQLFADAARYQLQGDSAVAKDLVTHGLERSGVSAPVIVKVKHTLETKSAPPSELRNAVLLANASPKGATEGVDTQWLESARLHFAAGQSSEGYVAVANYLKDEIPSQQATAFYVGFVEPINKSNHERSISDPVKGSGTAIASKEPSPEPTDPTAKPF